jgi:hypothetical protein
MNKIKTIISISLAMLLMACANKHHDNVRSSANDENYVKLTSVTKTEAGAEAIRQSNYFCEKQDKTAYVLNESIEYTGTQPENEYLTNRGLVTAVQTAGSTLWLLGGNSVDDVGAAMAVGGEIAGGAVGQPYELNMSFTCR